MVERKKKKATGRKCWRTAGFLAHSVRSSARQGEKGREFSVAALGVPVFGFHGARPEDRESLNSPTSMARTW